jgi:four helix bundle protein
MTTNFHGIKAWQKAHEFVLHVYRAVQSYPDYEKFGLCSQFRRAAVSVPANIAEGYKKISSPDKLRFYNIAQGSLEECRYYVILSRALGYIDETTHNSLSYLAEETSKLLTSYCKGLMDKNFSNQM